MKLYFDKLQIVNYCHPTTYNLTQNFLRNSYYILFTKTINSNTKTNLF